MAQVSLRPRTRQGAKSLIGMVAICTFVVYECFLFAFDQKTTEDSRLFFAFGWGFICFMGGVLFDQWLK